MNQGSGRPDRSWLGTLRPAGVAGVAWGVTLLRSGPELFGRLEHREPLLGEQEAITVLGLRHVAQGVVQLLVPRHLGWVYAAVDGIHAASMVAVAAGDSTRRRAALVSAGVAAGSGLVAAHSALLQRRRRSGRA